MLKRIVMQLSGLGTDLSIRLWGWLTTRLWKPVSSLPASFTRKFQSAINLLNPLAQMLPSFKAWAANRTTAAQSTKQEPTTAKAKVIPIGSRLLTTVHQISQRVRTVLLQKIDKLVALIKLVQLRLNESKIALTRMVVQLTQAGLKLLDRVKQHLQPALLLQNLNKKLVALTNLVQLAIKKVVVALTRMGNLLKVIGLKQVGTVRQPPQRAQRRRSKGH